MSLILDALKKAEKERQQNSGSGDALAAPKDESKTGSRPRWQWLAILVAVPMLAFAAGGSIGFFRLVPVPEATTPPVRTATTPRTPKPAAPASARAEQAAPVATTVATSAHQESVAAAPLATPQTTPPAPTPATKEPVAAPTSAAPSPATPPVQAVTAPPPLPAPQPMPAPKAAEDRVAPAAPVPSSLVEAEPPAATPGRLAAVAVPKKPAAPVAARDLPPGNSEAQVLARRGRGYEDKGLYDQAIDAYSQAIVLDPGFADAYFGRGWARLAKGAYGDAAGDFRRLIALRPTADAHFSHAWALEQQGDVEQAIRQYGEAIRLQPGHADAYFSRGVLEFTAGRMDAAARDFAAVHETAGDGLSDYARLWRHVAEARAGGAPVPALVGWQGKGSWPGVLAKLFRGEASPEQVLAAAKSNDATKQRENECVALFFLAQYRLVNGDPNGAAGYFRRTLATGVTHFRQYWAARAELERLGKAN